MIKYYELIKQNAGRLVTTYCGVTVTLNFENGNTVMNKNAVLVTNNKFIQDAIENDDRFGVTIKLGRSIAEDSDKAVVESPEEEAQVTGAETQAPVVKKSAKAKASKAVKAEAAPAAVAEAEKVFGDINDAVAFLEEKGEVVETPEQLAELLAKYGAKMEE